ncbi:sensor domain-containing diguanylate cyclase [Noviherbaspirillum galbum]|uniref:diguanylate cyclase n=1 Tax=Noviherbaspirillum galbum TaxID=2709383 RepID=A0A6B3SG63_9BURK|nr:sensor domain-containing diguanylate cyclase [Noviherbaspirillum galbum]NEX59844.1 diguanylate cyclase [Noviherbaspirillum galbum]
MTRLEDEYEALIQFLYLAPVGLVQLEHDGGIMMLNPVSAQLLMPMTQNGELTNLFDALSGVAPDLRQRCAAFTAPHGRICDALRLQFSAGTPGKKDTQFLSLSLLKLDDSRLMAVLEDITGQVRREEILSRNKAWLNAILAGISDYAVMSINSEGLVEDWNDSIGRLTGWGEGEILGQPYDRFFMPGASTPDALTDRLREAEDCGWSLREVQCRRHDGTPFFASTLIVPVHSAGPTSDRRYCLVIRNIADKKEALESQFKAAYCDYLTGLPNRRAFFEEAQREFDRMQIVPRHISLILFDADNFKRINDRYGHPAGDAVLCDLADRMRQSFRMVDSLCRMGGEEFAVLLPSTDLDAALAGAERFRQLVESQPVTFDGEVIAYSVSGGVATNEAGCIDIDELIKRADRALYEAKQKGRNRICAWDQRTELKVVA